MRTTLTALLVLTLATPAHATGEAQRAFALRGLWYSNGFTSRPCNITFVEVNPLLGTYLLVFTNELGQKNLGVNLVDNVLAVQNFGSVQGTLLATYSPDPTVSSTTVINWGASRGFWSRTPDLSGRWFAKGNRKAVCTVIQSSLSTKAEFINAQNQKALAVIKGDTITIDIWGGKKVNLTGRVKSDRIEWDNGTFWTRN
jgi:hypothetical protein